MLLDREGWCDSSDTAVFLKIAEGKTLRCEIMERLLTKVIRQQF